MRQNKQKYQQDLSELKPWQHKMHEIIYEADTFAGKFFDIALLICIVLSILIVMLESIPSLDIQYHQEFIIIEWIFLTKIYRPGITTAIQTNYYFIHLLDFQE